MNQPPQATVFTTKLYHIVKSPDARYRLIPKDPTAPRPATAYRGLDAAIIAAAQFEYDQLHPNQETAT